MAVGLESAYGLTAGFQALHDIIAERKKDELLKQHEEDQRQQFQLQWRQQEEARKFREMQLTALEADRKSRNEDRDLVRKSMDEARQATIQKQKADLIQNRLKLLPIGYQGSARDVSDAETIGAEGLWKPNKLDPKTLATTMAPSPLGGIPVAPQSYTYSGDADAQAKAAKEKQDLAQDADRRAQQVLLLKLAMQKPQVTFIPSTMAPGGMVAGQSNPLAAGGIGISPIAGTGQMGGAFGPEAVKAMAAAQEPSNFVNALSALEEVGNKYDWKGLGPMAGMRGSLARNPITTGLVTMTPAEIEMQAALENARSYVGHARFGGALTEGEKEILNRFMADSMVPGRITREMVAAVKKVSMDVLARTQQGVFSPLQGQSSTGGSGGAFGLDPYLSGP
jgi:hypothetical protein